MNITVSHVLVLIWSYTVNKYTVRKIYSLRYTNYVLGRERERERE